MAITYVGGQVAGRANPSAAVSVNFGLSGGSDAVPAAGDFVIITCVTGSAAGNPAMAVTTPTGYTALGQLNQSAVTADTSMDVSYKRMGGTPDTAFTVPGTTNSAWGEAYSVQVFRGVDATTPMDATAVSAGGTATGRPDPGSITPVTTGAWVVICGGGAAGTGVVYTAPANYTTNFLSQVGADTTDAMVGSGYWTGWTSGAENPAAYTGGTTGANDSWASYTLALRPAADTQALTPGLYSNSGAFYAPTVSPGAVALTPGLFTNSGAFYAATVAPGSVGLVADLFSNSATFYVPTVAPGAVALTAGLLSNSSAFYAATVAPGAVALTPERHDNASTFYAATVEAAGGTQDLAPGLVTNTAVFYDAEASSTYTLSPALMGGAEAFFAPTVGVGAVNLAASLVVNVSVFYSAWAGEPPPVLGAGRSSGGTGPIRPSQTQIARGRSVQSGARSNTQTAKR